MIAPDAAVPVGNVFTTATIVTGNWAPLTNACTTEPGPTSFASANALVAIAGSGVTADPAGALRVTWAWVAALEEPKPARDCSWPYREPKLNVAASSLARHVPLDGRAEGPYVCCSSWRLLKSGDVALGCPA